MLPHELDADEVAKGDAVPCDCDAVALRKPVGVSNDVDVIDADSVGGKVKVKAKEIDDVAEEEAVSDCEDVSTDDTEEDAVKVGEYVAELELL